MFLFVSCKKIYTLEAEVIGDSKTIKGNNKEFVQSMLFFWPRPCTKYSWGLYPCVVICLIVIQF